jgi:hypothetical protein
MLEARRVQVQFLMRSLDFLVDLILPVALRPCVDSASNRNEYQESSWGAEKVVGKTISLPALC